MKAWTLTAIVVLVLCGFAAWYFTSRPAGPAVGELDMALAACNSFPNGSTQSVTETSRLTIYLPKNIYPTGDNLLTFTTASGTATAGWISNAGPVGDSYGASADCWAYYYEFEGNGIVDLTATSSTPGIPAYVVHFQVGPAIGDQTIQYRNDQYGFTVALPMDWQNFSIVKDTWQGEKNGADGEVTATSGPEILIRNPKWTKADPYQDIPIMVFTIDQWNELQDDEFHIGAAPINPSELGRNKTFVFALPARYNFAFPTGYQEVEAILATHPLKTF